MWATSMCRSLSTKLDKYVHLYLHNGAHMFRTFFLLTPKIGKSRVRLGRPVRPGLRGGLTKVSCSRSGTKPARRSNRPQGHPESE
jgi:hypothetical protein